MLVGLESPKMGFDRVYGQDGGDYDAYPRNTSHADNNMPGLM